MTKGKQNRKSVKAKRENKAMPQSPLEMTQAEVEILIKGGSAAKEFVKRLHAQPTPKTSSSPRSKQSEAKSSPAQINRKEMEEFKKSGVISSKVRTRIEKLSSEGNTAPRKSKVKKEEPGQVPPTFKSAKN